MRERWFRLLAPITGVLLVLAAAELGLRLAGYDPVGRYLRVGAGFLRESEHPDLDYVLEPGAQGFAWGTTVSVNSSGFRDREYARQKPPGTRRVVVLGDSIAFGNHLDVDRTFPEQLEAMFRSAGKSVDVLNLAVGGYHTLNEVAFLEQLGLSFDPDVVVVQFCINDLGVHPQVLEQIRLLRLHGDWIRRLRILQLVAVGAERLRFSQDSGRMNEDAELQRRFAGRIAPLGDDPRQLARLEQLQSRLARIGSDRRLKFLSWYTSPVKVGRLRHALERLSRLASERGFAVVVVIVPFLDDGGHPEAYRLAYDIVAHEASRVGLSLLDLVEAFRAGGFERLRQVRGARIDPLHPNERGHRLIAQRLFAQLARPGGPLDVAPRALP